MAGIFRRLLGRPAKPIPREPDAEDYRIAIALTGVLQKQLALIDLEIGGVPATEPYISPGCRGALLGLAIGVLQAEGIEPTRNRCIDTVIATFVMVYGEPVGRSLAAQSVEESAAGHEAINRTSEFGIADVKGVYESGGVTNYTAFSLALWSMI